jgi:hypothetical protein
MTRSSDPGSRHTLFTSTMSVPLVRRLFLAGAMSLGGLVVGGVSACGSDDGGGAVATGSGI